ncbi:hypothetical protein GCM10007301_06540 [Azorhizobium oxalatiphilum]|uniref:Cache domain-containing protein n=1 Tax=Azorhizobium oxalatiphilum TaxID=980631 RepID=A0A917BMR6_9HYPH|nr:cache domain-containing protein [Azorhizobium oxalatiphilum]GGF49979.1 hypothetical protein GCM10007301_06540 [Azorhizobium oxalatiphilum]
MARFLRGPGQNGAGGALPQRPRGWRLAVLALAGAALLIVTLLLVLADRAAEMAAARARVVRSLAAVTETLAATRRNFDLVLERVGLELEVRSLADVRDDRAVHQLMVEMKNRLPNAESVFVVDADGRTVTSSRAYPMPPYDVRERDYFRVARAGETGSYVSLPFRGQMSRTTSFVVSRPVLHEGRLAGLVAITVFPVALTSSYQAMLGDADMVLARRDGAVLIRTDGARAVERLPEQGEVMRLADEAGGGVIHGASFIDGGRALQGVHVLPEGDLVVAVAIPDDEILAGWKRRALIAGGGALLAFLGIAAVLFSRATARPAEGARRHGASPARPPGGAGEADAVVPGGIVRDALPVLGVLAANLRAAGKSGDTAAGARLDDLTGLLGDAPERPALIDPAEMLVEARALLAGGGAVDLALAPPVGDVRLLVDGGRLVLAVLDVATGLAALAPAGRGLTAALALRDLEGARVHDLPAGTYVRVRLEVAGVEAHDTGAPAGRFALASAWAAGGGGACMPPMPDGPLRAELWLPHTAPPPLPRT